jgi:hypothetical protein
MPRVCGPPVSSDLLMLDAGYILIARSVMLDPGGSAYNMNET